MSDFFLKMMSHLLDWVKLPYALSTSHFLAPSRTRLRLCFSDDVAHFVANRVALSFVAYTWASGCLCVCISHTQFKGRL